MKIVIASRNRKKIDELEKILKCEIFEKMPEILSLDDIGYTDEIEENGITFEENAMIKADAVYNFCKIPVFADDSGLCVEALEDQPGIYSARYAGEEKNDEKNIIKLLDNLKNESNRHAKFVCAVAYINQNGEKVTFRGECYGEITNKKIGQNGFGYDPIFYLSEYGMTFAELSQEVKNRISHRALAMKKLVEIMKENN